MRPNLNSPYFVLLSIVADAAAVMGLIVQSMDACTIYFREQRVPTGMELVKLVMWALFALGSAILSVCVFKSLGKSSLARKYKKDIEPRKKKEIVLEWLKFQTKSGEGCSLFVVRILTYSAIALLALNLAMHGTMGILTPVGRRIYGAYCLTPQAATSVAMRMETALARTRVVTPRPLATPIVTQMPSPSPTAVQNRYAFRNSHLLPDSHRFLSNSYQDRHTHFQSDTKLYAYSVADSVEHASNHCCDQRA